MIRGSSYGGTITAPRSAAIARPISSRTSRTRSYKHDLRAEATRVLHLDRRRVRWHHDGGANAEQLAGGRHALRVIAGGPRDDTRSGLLRIELRQAVVRAPKLEGTPALQGFGLDEQVAPGECPGSQSAACGRRGRRAGSRPRQRPRRSGERICGGQDVHRSARFYATLAVAPIRGRRKSERWMRSRRCGPVIRAARWRRRRPKARPWRRFSNVPRGHPITGGCDPGGSSSSRASSAQPSAI